MYPDTWKHGYLDIMDTWIHGYLSFFSLWITDSQKSLDIRVYGYPSIRIPHPYISTLYQKLNLHCLLKFQSNLSQLGKEFTISREKVLERRLQHYTQLRSGRSFKLLQGYRIENKARQVLIFVLIKAFLFKGSPLNLNFAQLASWVKFKNVLNLHKSKVTP